MPHFLSRNRKKFSINFSEIENEAGGEAPFWEVQRAEAIDILTTFFSSWQLSWQNTKNALTDLNLTAEDLRRLNFYEIEQKKTVLSLLAATLIAWEKDDSAEFANAVMSLARELRPSLNHFETSADNHLVLTAPQTKILKTYITSEAASLKSTITRLQQLSWHKLDFGDKVLNQKNAESLLKEKLNLTYFEFLDFNSEPEFNAHGFLPSLLQDSADFGL